MGKVWGLLFVGLLSCGPRSPANEGVPTVALVAGRNATTPPATSSSVGVRSPEPPIAVLPPDKGVCRLAGKQGYIPSEDAPALPVFSLRLTPGGESFGHVRWDDGVTVAHIFPEGVNKGSYVSAHGGGVTVGGWVTAPRVFAKDPMTIVSGLDIDGTHPLVVKAAMPDGKLQLRFRGPFQTPAELETVRDCNELNAQPTSFGLPPLPDYQKPIGKRTVADDEELWIQTQDILAWVTGPMTVPVFARKQKQERVMLTFQGGRLHGWTTPPQPGYGARGRIGAMGFGRTASSVRRSCNNELALYTRVKSGPFAHVGTVAAGTLMMMFRGEAHMPFEGVSFRLEWLAGGRYFVPRDELAACTKR